MLEGDFEVMYRCRRVLSFAPDGEKTLCTFTDSNKEIFADHLKSHLEVFKCDHCPFTSKDGDQFEKHLKECEVPGFRCTSCRFICDSDADLREHILDHSYFCKECDFKDPDPINYGKHVLRHFEHILPLIDIANKRFICDECPFQTVNWPKFEHHLNSHKKTFQCLDCDLKFSSKVDLVKHVETHKKPKKIVKLFKCDKCQYAAKSEADLKSHAREHILHKCPECKEVFRELYDLQAHYAFHNIVETDFSCAVCWKEFPTSNKLKTHLQCHTETKFHCAKCSFSTKYKHSYVNHIKKCGSPKCEKKKKRRKSTTLKPSKRTKTCSKCGEQVGTTRSALMFHIREKHNENYHKAKVDEPEASVEEPEAPIDEEPKTMEVEEPEEPQVPETQEVPEDVPEEKEEPSKEILHSCNTCDLKFSSKKLLSEHKMTHIEQPIYNCLFCDVSFKEAEMWAKHMSEEHAKEKETHKKKLIRCHLCDRYSKSAMALKMHFKIAHVDEPKICQICGKRIQSMGFFSHHIKVAHKGCTINWCIFCGENYEERAALMNHLKEKHKNNRLVAAASIYGGLEDEKMVDAEVPNPPEEDELKFPCILCNLRYKNWSSLKYHAKAKHLDEKVILCGQCTIMYNEGAEHACKPKPQKEKQKDDPEKATTVEYVSCTLCPNMYTSKKSLNSHIYKKHRQETSTSEEAKEAEGSDIKGFHCPKCALTFSKNEYLLNHMRSHPDS